jgi:glycosyltransferase involved in cell wall biosynthesis
MVALRERGHTLELACPTGARLGDRAEDIGFSVHRIPMRGGRNLNSILKLAQILRSGHFDIINTHSGHDSLLGGMAGRLARTPLIVRTRHLALAVTSLATYKWLPHKVVAVSDWVRRYLVSAGVPEDMTVTVHTGIISTSQIENSTLRSELGLTANDILIGTVAIMRLEKGHRELIDAAIPVLEARPNTHLVFAGDGPLYDQVLSYCLEKGVNGRVHLLGLRNDVANVLAGCNFFALATWQEALGTSFIEAMAAGLATIGTAVDGVPEVIADNVTGILVPPRDQEALTRALFTLADDAALCRRMGQAGLAVTRTRFSVATMASEMEAFYLRSLAERRRA